MNVVHSIFLKYATLIYNPRF